MSRTASGRRPAADPNSIEAKYLKATVGPSLIRGLAEIVERRPHDPIEYLASFLYKQVENERNHQQKIEEKKRLELEIEQAEQEKIQRAQLRKERQALREREEYERKQREAEEIRRREAEELAKRHKEMGAAIPPSLPAVREEDDELPPIDFGETELHRQAKTPNGNLTSQIRENYHLISARDSEGKTARDLAVESSLQENVEQIDDFCADLIRQGNVKAMIDLILSGYSQIVNQARSIDDLNEEINSFVQEEIPQLIEKSKEFQQSIRDGDLNSVENLLNERKQLAFYRDREGSTALHDAVERKQFQIALNLFQRFSVLSHVKDSRNRTPIDLLNGIDDETLTDEQREAFEQLREAFQTGTTHADE